MTWPKNWNEEFLRTPGLNDAERYGVKISPAIVQPNQPYWRVIGVHHLLGPENHGQHHIFVDVLDEQGKRLEGTRLQIFTDGKPRGSMVIDKPAHEAGTNTHMHFNDTLTVFVDREGLPSESVTGLHARHDDEGSGTTRGHHSFYAVWQRYKKVQTGPSPSPTPTPEPIPPANNSPWLSHFDERQQKEIAFCRLYAKEFAHGSVGHNEKLIIAKLAELLDKR